MIPAPDELPYPQSTQTMKNFGGTRCSPTGEMTLAENIPQYSCNTAFGDLAMASARTRCATRPRTSG